MGILTVAAQITQQYLLERGINVEIKEILYENQNYNNNNLKGNNRRTQKHQGYQHSCQYEPQLPQQSIQS